MKQLSKLKENPLYINQRKGLLPVLVRRVHM